MTPQEFGQYITSAMNALAPLGEKGQTIANSAITAAKHQVIANGIEGMLFSGICGLGAYLMYRAGKSTWEFEKEEAEKFNKTKSLYQSSKEADSGAAVCFDIMGFILFFLCLASFCISLDDFLATDFQTIKLLATLAGH